MLTIILMHFHIETCLKENGAKQSYTYIKSYITSNGNTKLIVPQIIHFILCSFSTSSTDFDMNDLTWSMKSLLRHYFSDGDAQTVQVFPENRKT